MRSVPSQNEHRYKLDADFGPAAGELSGQFANSVDGRDNPAVDEFSALIARPPRGSAPAPARSDPDAATPPLTEIAPADLDDPAIEAVFEALAREATMRQQVRADFEGGLWLVQGSLFQGFLCLHVRFFGLFRVVSGLNNAVDIPQLGEQITARSALQCNYGKSRSILQNFAECSSLCAVFRRAARLGKWWRASSAL